MKIEPFEVLNMVADSATELVNEHSELSEQILEVMKMFMDKMKNKLLMFEVGDLGLSVEELDSVLNKKG